MPLSILLQEPDVHDHMYMSAALAEARKAASAGEVPVGAVLVLRDEVIVCAHNSTASSGDPTAHAEMSCIQQAARALGSWRLCDATLYCTLEPCAMCAGAMLQSRVGTLVYGARNALSGDECSLLAVVLLTWEHTPAKQVCARRRSAPTSPSADTQARTAAGSTSCRVHHSSLGCGLYDGHTPFTQTCRWAHESQ